MAAFAVLEPPRRHRGASEHADRFLFLRDRFSLGAFLFGPLWMIWRRLWLALTIYLVIAGLIGYALQIVGIDWTVVTLVFGLIQLLIGLEGTNLVRWSRVRHGWYDHGVVIADDRELAERRFFDSRRAVRPADGSVAASAPTLPPASEVGQSRSDVVGLFPEPGGGL